MGKKNNISIMLLTLLILTVAVIKMDLLTKFDYRRKIFRYLFLTWILVWLGWIAGGQITILSIFDVGNWLLLIIRHGMYFSQIPYSPF